MWRWLFGRKKPPVPVGANEPARPLAMNPANPGRSLRGEIRLNLSGQAWTEGFDCQTSLAATLERRGREPITGDGVVEDPHTGYVFRPLLVSCQAAGYRSIRTVTTIEFTHPKLFPESIFEFQHGYGSTAAEAIASGFEQWSEIDWPTLLDATRAKPTQCIVMTMEVPQDGDSQARVRRIVFGPVAHLQPPDAPPAEPLDGQEHPFCPCCLFTQTLTAYRSLIESDQTWGLRLFAGLDAAGHAEADCRANGQDYLPGQHELRRYGNSWPKRGVEFCKQYVLIHNAAARPAESI